MTMKLHSYVMTNRMLKKWSRKHGSNIAQEQTKARLAANGEETTLSDKTEDSTGSDDEWLHNLERAAIFPNNVTLENFWLFLWTPSLVYEPIFLRRPSKRSDDRVCAMVFRLHLYCDAEYL
jgi:hypothetical protein